MNQVCQMENEKMEREKEGVAHEEEEDEIGEQSATGKLQALWEFTSYQTCLQTFQPFLRGTMSIGTAVLLLITIEKGG